jgi:ABC-type uncharacterized transport system permease subunit
MLPSSLFSIITLLAYICAITLLWNSSQLKSHRSSVAFTITCLVACIFHGLILYRSLSGAGINSTLGTFSWGIGISMAGWFSGLLYLLGSRRKTITNLGLIVLPVAAIAMLAGTLLPGEIRDISSIPTNVILHISLAIAAYGFLCLAFAQACLLIVQEKQLKNPSSSGLLPGLPPIQSMEHYLFLFIILGFIFMTINLIVGTVSSLMYRQTLISFNHHTVLSLIAWSWFGILLLGRQFSGWRGETAAKWTIGAFSVLFLAYFGTRFVNEFILQN